VPETEFSAFAAVVLGMALLLVLALPRRYVVVPLLLGALLVPTQNVLVVAGFHFMPIRLLGLAGCARWLVSRPQGDKSRLAGGWNGIDRALLGWGIAAAAAISLQWMNMQALYNQIGVLTATFGIYFALRQLIRDDEDIARVIRVLAAVAVINVVSMISEQLTLHNLFGAIMGGVDASPLIREGRIRAQGAFQHAILAGVFGATLVPLCCWLWKSGRSRPLAVLGVLTGTGMTLMSSSSTPVMALGGSIIALFFWPLRKSMRLLRWGLSATLITLHLVMKVPVWFLIARIDVVGGSASWDRANLIDTCVKHFWDWWLVGTHNTGNWGWSMWDLSNQFVSVAETGGLLALVLFIAIVSRAFGALGMARKVAGTRGEEWRIWFLGAALFAHILAYFGVSYFDQTQVVWFVLLAIIAATTGALVQSDDQAETLAEAPTVVGTWGQSEKTLQASLQVAIPGRWSAKKSGTE